MIASQDTFFSLECKASGKGNTTFRTDGRCVVITSACLGDTARKGDRAVLSLQLEAIPGSHTLCSLAVGGTESFSLDVVLECDAVFMVRCTKSASVHLTGRYLEEEDDDDELYGMGDDSDEDSDQDPEFTLSDAVMENGELSDDDDDDEEEEEEGGWTLEGLDSAALNDRSTEVRSADLEEDDEEDGAGEEEEEEEEEEESDEAEAEAPPATNNGGSIGIKMDSDEESDSDDDEEGSSSSSSDDAAAAAATTPSRKRGAPNAVAKSGGSGAKKARGGGAGAVAKCDVVDFVAASIAKSPAKAVELQDLGTLSAKHFKAGFTSLGFGKLKSFLKAQPDFDVNGSTVKSAKKA